MYLAISKILYWVNTIGEIAQSDFDGVGMRVLSRALGREIPIILVVTCIILIDVMKGKLLIKIVIGYVASLGAILLYYSFLGLLWQTPPGLADYINQIVGFTIQYAIVSVALTIKYYFKEKAEELAEAEDKDKEAAGRRK